MYRVTEELRFCYGHRLMEYEGPCARLHGHNARVQIELSATTLNRLGFVTDFYDVEKAARDWLMSTFDHRLLLRDDDPVIPHLRAAGEPFVALPFNPSAENLARMIFEHLVARGLPVTAVRFFETETSVASYTDDTR
jgi:6-pyruvoyltetrahydropterin/6-carboxytetrahydropterin synthase